MSQLYDLDMCMYLTAAKPKIINYFSPIISWNTLVPFTDLYIELKNKYLPWCARPKKAYSDPLLIRLPTVGEKSGAYPTETLIKKKKNEIK